ncbi:MAG: hypothetical protein U0X73_09645 [Thermoanaerobaculia bacterium]
MTEPESAPLPPPPPEAIAGEPPAPPPPPKRFPTVLQGCVIAGGGLVLAGSSCLGAIANVNLDAMMPGLVLFFVLGLLAMALGTVFAIVALVRKSAGIESGGGGRVWLRAVAIAIGACFLLAATMAFAAGPIPIVAFGALGALFLWIGVRR